MRRIQVFMLVVGSVACSDAAGPQTVPNEVPQEFGASTHTFARLQIGDELVVELESFGCYHWYKSHLRFTREPDGSLKLAAQTAALWGERRGQIEQTLTRQQERDLEVSLQLLRRPGIDQFCRTSTSYQLRWAGEEIGSVESITDGECRGLTFRSERDRIPLTPLWIASKALQGERVVE